MTKFQPDGWHTATPRIIVHNPEALIAFIKHVFGGRGDFHRGRPSEMQIATHERSSSSAENLR